MTHKILNLAHPSRYLKMFKCNLCKKFYVIHDTLFYESSKQAVNLGAKIFFCEKSTKIGWPSFDLKVFFLIIENYFGGLSAAPGPVEFHATFALGKDCNLDTWEILFSDCNLGLCSHVKVWRGPADYDVCSSKLMIESFLLNEPIHLRGIVYCSRTHQNTLL